MSSSEKEYKAKLQREQRFHTECGFQVRHFLNSKLFFSIARNEFNYSFARQRLAKMASQLAARWVNPSQILIAPVGTGSDIPFLEAVSKHLTGIDVSPEAISQIHYTNVVKVVGDIKKMDQFKDESFDMVVSSLFYHHFVRFGFDPFLRETLRVLRPGGHLLAMEPSATHPIHWLTALGRMVFGNITGTVSDEAPLKPRVLAQAMRRCGFQEVRVQAASFSHHRLPIWLAKINNILTLPLTKVPVLCNCAWLCIFYGQKHP
jgi:SAM-dependent methyltransferase